MSKGSVDDGVVFHAGFPNAAEDQRFGSLSLDTLVVKHRASTYFWMLETDVAELLWSKDSVLVVDRAETPKEGNVLVAVVEGDFLLCRFHKKQLHRLNGEAVLGEVIVWGVVMYCIQKVI